MAKINATRVVKDSPMRGTLGKRRIRKAIQEVLRESPAAESFEKTRGGSLSDDRCKELDIISRSRKPTPDRE